MMCKGRFSEEQIITILREQEAGMPSVLRPPMIQRLRPRKTTSWMTSFDYDALAEVYSRANWAGWLSSLRTQRGSHPIHDRRAFRSNAARDRYGS
jgi:hypothetical protein